MTDKVQKIGEEVVRLHNLLPTMDGDNISVNYADRICTTLEMYIASLQEEPVSEEIEAEFLRAAHNLREKPLLSDWFRHFYIMGKNHQEPVSEDLEQEINAEWNCYSKDGQVGYINRFSFELIARHFANWQRQQMMAKAVDGVVHRLGGCGVASVHYNDPNGVPMAYFIPSEGLSAGDKVKIITIKED